MAVTHASDVALAESEREFPVPPDGTRFRLPPLLAEALVKHPLSRDIHPRAVGFYPTGRAVQTRQLVPIPEHLLIYCTGGGGDLLEKGCVTGVVAGDLVLVRKGELHRLVVSSANPWTLRWFTYDGELADSYNTHLGMERSVVHIGLRPDIVRAFDALFALRNASLTLNTWVQGSCQLKALIAVLANTLSQLSKGPGERIDIEKIHAFMLAHIGSGLNLTELARSANLSSFYFVRRFKKITGVTPMHYFINLKMQRACQLLDGTAQPVKWIAAEVGYDDPQYFSRIFKRVLGLTPQQYRVNQHQELG
jgi:AraC-like DNA-binding protein